MFRHKQEFGSTPITATSVYSGREINESGFNLQYPEDCLVQVRSTYLNTKEPEIYVGCWQSENCQVRECQARRLRKIEKLPSQS